MNLTPLASEIRRIRLKLQLERLVKGAAIVLGAFLAVTLLSAYVLSRSNFSDTAILWTRLLGGGLLLALLVRQLLIPALRWPSNRKVARFLEERHPQLQDRLSTAVEVGQSPSRVHPAIRRLLERDAATKLRGLDRPTLYHRRASIVSMLAVAACLAALSTLFLTGPAAFNYSLAKLSGAADDAPPLYSIRVTPGDVKVVRHADVEIQAVLVGFDSEKVRLRAKYENQPAWEEVAMRPADTGSSFVSLFFDAREKIEYYVEADGIESDHYTITVSEAPAVAKLRLTLNFPSYTGLKPEIKEDEGDIRALVGTAAEFVIETDQAVKAGKIKLEEGGEVALQLDKPNQLTGSFKVSVDDFYRIHLQNLEGVWSPASDEYLVAALQDQPPTVLFSRPGRDSKVTNLEEVFTEVKAQDDYGVTKLTLHYSVNGGSDQSLPLDAPRGARSITSSHTFYLEEFSLQPGDFVSYFAEASDSASTSKSDLYFLEVEPYDREYRQSQQGGGGAGAEDDLILSKFEKEIIAATFNVLRDREKAGAGDFKENVQTVALMQQQLQQQAETIVDRIERRGAVTDTAMFRDLKAYLHQAVTHMGDAHQKLALLQAQEALPHEQKAYQQLLRAESLFKEIQISMGDGGQAGNSSAEQLADLVDLELDKTKNQYETLQQNREQNRDQALDEAAQKLKELAKRQQQELERRRREAAQSSNGSGSSQEDLLNDVEELARQLERLSREQRDQNLGEVGRQLKQAARDLRQSQQSGNPQQAQMQAQRALERLQQARDALNQQRQSEVNESLQKLAQESRDLAERQKEISERVRNLEEMQKEGSLGEDYMKEQRVVGREKSDLQGDLQRLESDIHQSARRLASQEPEAARHLKDAGNSIRDHRTPEKMQESGSLLRRNMTTLARQREESVEEDLQELAEKVAKAEGALGQGNPTDPKEKMERALGRIGELVENLDSLSQRAGKESGEQPGGETGDKGEKGKQPGESDKDGQQPGESGKKGEQAGRQGKEGARPGPGQSGDRPGQKEGQGDSGEPGKQGQNSRPGATQEGDPTEAGGSNGGPPSLTEGSRRPASEASMASNSGGINPSQVRREWQERVRDAEEIQKMLKGLDPTRARDVAELARRMREIDARRVFNDPEEIAALKAQIIDGFRQLELDLYRSLKKDGEQLRLAHEDEVPPEFRERVEEYYRSLAGGDKKPPR